MNWDGVHVRGVHRLLDHFDEGVGRHISLKHVSQDEAGVVVHQGDQIVVAPAYNPEVGGICGPHLVRTCCLAVILLTRGQLTAAQLWHLPGC